MSGIHPVLRFFYSVVLLAAIVFASPVRAETPQARALALGERALLQALVQEQLNAFQRDDGETAYAFAGSRAHQIFPDADTFMRMVRESYPPVYRPRSVVFGQLMETRSGPIQIVYLGGHDGNAYMALYTFERQSDGSWLIAGCLLTKNPGQAI